MSFIVVLQTGDKYSEVSFPIVHRADADRVAAIYRKTVADGYKLRGMPVATVVAIVESTQAGVWSAAEVDRFIAAATKAWASWTFGEDGEVTLISEDKLS